MTLKPPVSAIPCLPLHRRPSFRHKHHAKLFYTLLPPNLKKYRKRYIAILSLFLLLLLLINTVVLILNTHILHRWSFRFRSTERDPPDGRLGEVGRGKFGAVEVGEKYWKQLYETAKVFTNREPDERKRILEGIWEIPSVIVRELQTKDVEKLLFRMAYMELMMKVEGGLDVSLEGMKRGDARCVFVHVQNGLGNRLRAMGSGISLAKKTGRVSVVVWERDAHLSAKFDDLFVEKPMPSSRNPEVVLYRNLLIIEKAFPAWKHVATHEAVWRPYNYMLKDGDDAHIHFPLPLVGRGGIVDESGAVSHGEVGTESGIITPDDPISPTAHIYLKTAYVVQTIPRVVNRKNVNSELRRLTPVRRVIKLFNTYPVRLLQKAIGVHIRSRGLERDNVGVDMGCEYTATGARITEYWRSRSSKQVFTKQLERYVKKNENVTFFVAADDVAVIDDLNQKFPGKILSIPRNCDDRSPECVQYALADLMCLARTRVLIGSHWSSFTETASRLGGGKRVFLSGKDFGKKPHGIRDRFETVWTNFQDRYRFFSRCRKHPQSSTNDDRRR